MSRDVNIIKEGALFLSDVHYAPYREEILPFFEKLLDRPPEQLFLLGDIFDLLTPCRFQMDANTKLIEILQRLANKCEIYYFEGNHDLGIEKILKNITIFPRQKQPALFTFGTERVLLLHGDKYAKAGHEMYMRTISNRAFLYLLNTLDDLSDGFISKKITESIRGKKLCREFLTFKTVLDERLDKMDFLSADIVLEGHFHQEILGEEIEQKRRYFNIGSVACNESYFVVKSKDSRFSLEKCGIKEFLCQ